eukprot:6203872-Pleurochrysis_carterae.AAC.2
MPQTCQYRHSPNQSLVAHTGSATGSDHCPRTVLGCTRCTQRCRSGCVASMYATNTAVQSVAVLQDMLPPPKLGAASLLMLLPSIA